MKIIALISLIFCLFTIHDMKAQSSSESISTIIPSGWVNDGPIKNYTPENLYEYINGGAELYISYGMKSVKSQRIVHKTMGEIRIEIFDMVHAKNAFGVFTHTRTKDEKSIGQGSQYFTGAQIFWKGKYFVSVIADDDNNEIQDAILQISDSIEEQIQESGSIPKFVELLPKPKLVKDGYIFFHHYIWLNAYYFLSNENILNITNDCEAVIGKYGKEKEKHFLLVIKYPNNTLAQEAFDAFNTHFLDGKGKTTRIEDGTWFSGSCHDNYLIGVYNVPAKKEAETLLDLTEKGLNY